MTILPCFVVKLRIKPGCVGRALDFGQPSLRMSFGAKKPSMLMSFAFRWFSSRSSKSSVCDQPALKRLLWRFQSGVGFDGQALIGLNLQSIIIGFLPKSLAKLLVYCVGRL